MLIPNMTQPQATTLASRISSFSTATSSPIQHQQSQLSSGDAANLVFGCVASVLGILTLWGTFWLSGRRALLLRVVENGKSEG